MWKIFRGINGKIIVIVILVLAMIIPIEMISSLVREREHRKEYANSDVSSKWGMEQTIIGPVITIPYKTYLESDGKLKETINYKHFLPNKLLINGNLNSHIRERGIYEVVLYESSLKISGNFDKNTLSDFVNQNKDILWQQATLSLGVSDMKGIQGEPELFLGEQKLEIEPGIIIKDIFPSGISANNIEFGQKQQIDFDLKINLNGSKSLYFVPIGKNNIVELQSNWETPSFVGSFLPKQHNIDDKGFSSNWEISHLNRNYPQSWTGSKYKDEIYNSKYGVNLYVSADVYKQSIRSIKYAILFIIITFATFFCTEILNGNKVHPFQYLLIGITISIYYVLLLSLSEHINFDYAYLISSIVTVLIIWGYSKTIFTQKPQLPIFISGVLSILYAYLYMLLQLADYALLVGAIGIFISITVLMFITRKINWYEI